ncbi:MAG: phosphodiester glycosidase family protein [Firmicutes bacterium]|nr:phosphodiester glycosidase family protein [Bacillota bacterium]
MQLEEVSEAVVTKRGLRHKRKRRRRFWLSAFLVLVVAFGAWTVRTQFFLRDRVILAEDLFTSQHRYLAKYLVGKSMLDKIAYAYAHPSVVDLFPGGSSFDDPSATDGSVSSIDKAVSVRTLNEGSYTGYEITLTHPSWLRLAMTTGGPDGRGLTLREAMQKYGAIAGINAGGFVDPGGDGNGGTPVGLIIIDGKLVNPASYLVGTNQVMGMTANGQWFMGDYTGDFLLAHHVSYAIQFGPELIANGKVLVTDTDGWGYAPRTIIGQKANGEIVMWVNDGRWGNGVWDVGASLGQVASLLRAQGVVNAFNLDGGGSATMMVHLPHQTLHLVNTPDTNNPPYGMRFLPDAFLVIPPKP